MDYFIISLLLLSLLIVCLLSKAEAFIADFIPSQPWIAYPPFGWRNVKQCPGTNPGFQYQNWPTKCFSCEQDAIRRGLPVHLSHPTKCVDCDTQALNEFGWDYAFYGQPNKTFSTENTSGLPNPFRALTLQPEPYQYPHEPPGVRPNVDPLPS